MALAVPFGSQLKIYGNSSSTLKTVSVIGLQHRYWAEIGRILMSWLFVAHFLHEQMRQIFLEISTLALE